MSLITVNVTLPQGNRISLHDLHPSTAKEEIMTRVKALCPSLSLRARLHVIPPQVDFDRWMSDDYGFKGNSVVIPLVRTESLKKTVVYANPWEDEEEDNEEVEEDEDEDEEEEDEDEDEEEEEEDEDEEEEEEEDEDDEEEEEEEDDEDEEEDDEDDEDEEEEEDD